MDLEQSIKKLQDYNIKKQDPELQKFIIDIAKSYKVHDEMFDETLEKLNIIKFGLSTIAFTYIIIKIAEDID